MSTTSTPIAPEVRLFLAKVRQELSDLDPDEVREITDGLEADLGELVAERGPASLGDPVEYAGELRLAAGLPTSGGSAARSGVGDRVTQVLDRSGAFIGRQIDRMPGDVRPLLAWLRPLWWVVRGWAAAQLVATYGAKRLGAGYGNDGLGLDLIPHARGAGWLLLVIGIAVSIQWGRGKLWPAGRERLGARLLMIAINLGAVVALVPLATHLGEPEGVAYQSAYRDGYNSGYGDASAVVANHTDEAGIYSDGHWVSQVFPYDASGRPLTGIQLFDQTGQPIHVVTQPECDSSVANPLPPEEPAVNEYCQDPETGQALQPRIFYPWTNGTTQLYNVFPLTSRPQPDTPLSPTAFAEKIPPAVGPLPFATVPSVSLPGVSTK